VRAIDLFAGWGGFTAGAQEAGIRVVWAANHWRIAVDVHAANHPGVVHACQDLRQADWTTLPRFDLLLASPACQGHSEASQPRRRAYHDAMRATAWAVVDCADVTEPRALVVENVVSFLRWRLYPEWRAALERIGYRLTECRVLAADHGVPQLRERLFVVGLKRRAFALPLRLSRRPAFEACLDEPDAGGWRLVSRAAPGARERILRAQSKSGRRCLVQHVTGHPGVPLSEPIRTITTKDQWILVDGDAYRPLSLREYARGMGFHESYTWPARLARSVVVRGLGNAVCPPVARDVVRAVAEAA
jgi:DNA (cytosine-5)-methyltransferase 1